MDARERARRAVSSFGLGAVIIPVELSALEDLVAKAIREALDEVDTLATLKIRQGQNDLLSQEEISSIVLSVKGT